MFLLIDFINPQGCISFVDRLDKIKHNLDIIKHLKENVEKQNKISKGAFSVLAVCGRWLIVYQANIIDDNDTIMHFIDFRIDLAVFDNYQIFSVNTLKNLIDIQNMYDKIYKDEMDIVELTFAEPFEKIIKENLFTCDIDELVLDKARKLGVLPILEASKDGDRVKIVLADEKIKIDNGNIINIYAFIHFVGNSEESENGFAYIKIHDFINNFDKVKDLEIAIQNAGGKFDRYVFIERFDKYRAN